MPERPAVALTGKKSGSQPRPRSLTRVRSEGQGRGRKNRIAFFGRYLARCGGFQGLLVV
jgi:hypothetical protein